MKALSKASATTKAAIGLVVFILFALLVSAGKRQAGGGEALVRGEAIGNALPSDPEGNTDEDRDREATEMSSEDSVQISTNEQGPGDGTSGTPPAIRAKETASILLPGQKEKGYDAMITQAAKPLRCPKKSYWRGESEKGPSVEQRLDEAFKVKDSWVTDVRKAVAYCANGIPMMAQNEFGFLYNLLRPGDLMLEWGSGVSSCVWAYKIGELHSIEDNAGWAMKSRATFNRLENQVLHYMPPVEPTMYMSKTHVESHK